MATTAEILAELAKSTHPYSSTTQLRIAQLFNTQMNKVNEISRINSDTLDQIVIHRLEAETCKAERDSKEKVKPTRLEGLDRPRLPTSDEFKNSDYASMVAFCTYKMEEETIGKGPNWGKNSDGSYD